jgi:branched-chain amino acid transport system permease protein
VAETLAAGTAIGAIYGLLALGLVVTYQGSGVLNFAHGEMGTLSLFVASALVVSGWSWWGAAALSISLAGLIGGVFSSLVVRRLGDAPAVTLTVASIGLLSLLVGVELAAFGGEPRYLAVPFEGQVAHIGFFILTVPHLVALITLVLAASMIALGQRFTKVGVALVALADDAPTAQLVGVPRHRVAIGSWSGGAALAAVAGLLLQPLVGIFHVYSMTFMLAPALGAALVGGLRSPLVAALAAIALGMVEAVVRLTVETPGAWHLVPMATVLVVLLVRPGGIVRSA